LTGVLKKKNIDSNVISAQEYCIKHTEKNYQNKTNQNEPLNDQ
jgi:hypothetical protein